MSMSGNNHFGQLTVFEYLSSWRANLKDIQEGEIRYDMHLIKNAAEDDFVGCGGAEHDQYDWQGTEGDTTIYDFNFDIEGDDTFDCRFFVAGHWIDLSDDIGPSDDLYTLTNGWHYKGNEKYSVILYQEIPGPLNDPVLLDEDDNVIEHNEYFMKDDPPSHWDPGVAFSVDISTLPNFDEDATYGIANQNYYRFTILISWHARIYYTDPNPDVMEKPYDEFYDFTFNIKI